MGIIRTKTATIHASVLPLCCKMRSRGPFVRIISQDWLRRVGLASYSLYLWQQLSTGDPSQYHGNAALTMPIFFIGPALFSYFFIEKPMVRVGHRLSTMILAKAVRGRTMENSHARPSPPRKLSKNVKARR